MLNIFFLSFKFQSNILVFSLFLRNIHLLFKKLFLIFIHSYSYFYF